MKGLSPGALFALMATVAFGGTVKVPLKTGWRFMKADDPAAGTNLTMQAMSAILDRASRGDTADADDFVILAKKWTAGFLGRVESILEGAGVRRTRN